MYTDVQTISPINMYFDRSGILGYISLCREYSFKSNSFKISRYRLIYTRLRSVKFNSPFGFSLSGLNHASVTRISEELKKQVRKAWCDENDEKMKKEKLVVIEKKAKKILSRENVKQKY